MGKKIDRAYELIQAQAKHHLHLSQSRRTDFDAGFANGFAEALRIVAQAREN